VKRLPTLYSVCGTQLKLNPQFNPRVEVETETRKGREHKIRDITEGKCRHYYFGCFSIKFLSRVAITICSGCHYLLTEIEWSVSQNNCDDICLPLCLLFLLLGGNRETFVTRAAYWLGILPSLLGRVRKPVMIVPCRLSLSLLTTADRCPPPPLSSSELKFTKFTKACNYEVH